jgi:sugar phosphate permease
MFADSIAQRLSTRGIFYGWVCVACVFCWSLATAGAVGLPGAFILPLSKEFGWDTGQISSALAIRMMLFGVMAPFAAALIARYGMRRIILTSFGLMMVSLIAVQFMRELWHLVLIWGFFDGFATGLTSMALGVTLANRWFTARRGLVIGIFTAAVGSGQLVFLPLTAALIEKFGWRMALWPSMAILVLVAAAVLLLLRERPVDVGLPPLGEKDLVPAPAIVGSPLTVMKTSFSVLGEAARTGMFWILAGSFFVCGLSTVGLIQMHFIPFCADFGIGPVMAASALAMIGIFNIVGSIGSGILSDRFDNRWLLFWYYGLRGLSLIYLPFSDLTVVGLTIFAILYGLDWIATVPPTVKLCGSIFGREKAPIVYGWLFAAHQLGAAVAAFGAGASRTALLTYLPAFIFAGIACIVAAVLVLGVKREFAGVPKPAVA